MSSTAKEDNRRELWIVISVAFASFMAALDTYIVNVALPAISQYFNVGTGEVALITLAYLLVITSTLPIFGKVGDRAGFKKVFIAGFAFFAGGSLLCGLSPHILLLVGSRCIQGLGAAMLYAVGMAMIPRYLPENTRGWAFGITSTTSGLGVVVGAPLGGLITQYFSWHWIFFINVPVGIIAILVALKVIPGEQGKNAAAQSSRFDIGGAVLSFASIASLVYALNKGQEMGWRHPVIIALFIVFAVLFAAFVFWERRCKDPLLDLNIFKNRSYSFGNLAALFTWGIFAGGNFLLPFYLTLVKGLSASMTGVMFLISSCMYIVISPLAGRLSDRISTRLLCCIGTLACVLTLAFFAITLGLSAMGPVIIYLAVAGTAMGIFVPPNSNLILSNIPQESQGEGTAAFSVLRNLGMVLGVAIYAAVFNAHLPAASVGIDLAKAGVPQNVLLSGFRDSFFCGAAMCAIAFVFSLLASESRKHTADRNAGFAA